MCGIAGIWNFQDRVIPETLKKFTGALRHRGPDGAGFYFDNSESIGLGHCRLAILDISDSGKQPMPYADGRYWIIHNGEIFNFIELREELEGYGYQFRSQTDTETILAAYHKWGIECQYRFNGMWAFAIWDAQNKRIFLSRDRFGIKPLYYLFLPGRMFAFASETIAFSHLDNYRREFDEVKTASAIKDSYCHEGFGQTIFRDIHQILPGHFMIASKNSGISQKRWWSTFNNLEKVPGSYGQQTEKFKGLFRDACALRMRSDVPIATALSGGVDSSSVCCMLHNIMKRGHAHKRTPEDWQKAFVLAFPGSDLDESSYASEVAAYTNADAVYVDGARSDLVKNVVDTTIKFDSIYQSSNPAYEIYKNMREKNIKVSLDGHGADEILFGYPNLVAAAYKDAINEGLEDRAEDLFSIYIDMQEPYAQEQARRSLINYRKRKSNLIYKIYDKYVPAPLKCAYRSLSRIINGNSPPYIRWLIVPTRTYSYPDRSEDEGLSALPEAERISYLAFHRSILPTLLRNFDRASMSSGVEIRMPYMDWRLVTYAFSLPAESRVGKAYTKRILRDAMFGLMPENIRSRKLKLGLSAPTPEWLLGPLRGYIMDTVNSTSFLKSKIWNGPAIRDFTEERMKDRAWGWDDCGLLWPCINAHILMKGK